MKKEKRHSIRETMKKLKERILLLKKELLFYCPIDLGTFSSETYYAAFDEDGISIYQYDKSQKVN